jgi:hypothetical protein
MARYLLANHAGSQKLYNRGIGHVRSRVNQITRSDLGMTDRAKWDIQKSIQRWHSLAKRKC